MKEHKYEAIARTLENQIRQGVFKPGEKIPAELALVQTYSVSRQTIRQAISLLEKRGLLIQRQGSGTYVEADYSRVVQRHAKTTTIAVVPCFMSNYIFPSIMRGIEEIVSSAGYSVRLSPTQHRVDRERVILQQLLENPVDGLIVEGVKTCMPNPNIPLYRELQRRGMPIVFFNTVYPELDDVVLVSMDDFSVVRDGVKLLVENGHRNIAGIFRWDDRQGADRYFRDLGLVVYGLAALIVTDSCPYSPQQIGQILTGFSVAICKAIKEVPGFAAGSFDRDAVFHALLTKSEEAEGQA